MYRLQENEKMVNNFELRVKNKKKNQEKKVRIYLSRDKKLKSSIETVYFTCKVFLPCAQKTISTNEKKGKELYMLMMMSYFLAPEYKFYLKYSSCQLIFKIFLFKKQSRD